MRNRRNAGVIGTVLAGLVAAGCSGGQSDLQKWIETTKKKPGGRIQALPEVKPYETYVYSASKVRSPSALVCPRCVAALDRILPLDSVVGDIPSAEPRIHPQLVRAS